MKPFLSCSSPSVLAVAINEAECSCKLHGDHVTMATVQLVLIMEGLLGVGQCLKGFQRSLNSPCQVAGGTMKSLYVKNFLEVWTHVHSLVLM